MKKKEGGKKKLERKKNWDSDSTTSLKAENLAALLN